ncbi:hypothetical protein CALVIDRAFT_561889 [Calocera viscosa TUFC12733]|uniref:Uncharacterized protein n=1 Tax=Calocera viscosa (strain TUFC12733) TaxID=1330018 RepID=A0A167PN20_CALVF|nr:hypothetical protein CALVIDRAFT_561889 [Calocera viscosa TUFC12733]
MPNTPSSDDFDVDEAIDLTEEVLAVLKRAEEQNSQDRYTLSQVPLQQHLPRSQHPLATSTPAIAISAVGHTRSPGGAAPSQPSRAVYVRPPPPKKFKPNPYRPIQEEDDLPEITVDASGRYQVAGTKPASPSTAAGYNARPSGSTGHVRQPSGQWQQQARPPPRPPLGGRSSSSGVPQVQRPSPLAQSVTVSHQAPAPSVRPTTPVAPANGVGQGHARSSSQTAVSPGGAGAPDPVWEKELAALKAQMAQLQSKNQSLEAAKAAAEELQYAKAGEVSNVRRLMEQQSRANADALQKIKAEKEEVIKAKEAAEHDMRLEIERFKTQMMFKQHEFETTTKKPSWSVQRRGAQSQLQPGQTPARTPSRRRVGSSRPPSSPVQPTPVRPAPMFNGFHSGFETSQKTSPSRTRRPLNRATPSKGKGREGGNGWGEASERESVQSRGETQQLADDRPMEESVSMDLADVPMSETGTTAEPEPQEREEVEEETFFGPLGEGVSWRDELHHSVFKHRSLLYSSDDSDEPPPLTIQLLLTVTLPENTPIDAATTYRQHCSEVLSAFGIDDPMTVVGDDGSSEELNVVGQGLSQLAHVFCALELIKPLALCFDLLAFITFHIPAFRHVLLAVPPDAPDSPPTLLSALRDSVRLHLKPAKMREADTERRALAETCLTMMESVSWRIGEDDVLKLGILPTSQGFLSTLLSSAQPAWMVERSARFLCLLSSHSLLFRSMLSFPDQGGQPSAVRPDFACIPLIDMLSNFLVTPQAGATFEQKHSTFQAAICTMTSLSIAHPDGRQLLQGSRSLIPSLVRCLLSQSTHLWDEDESIIDSPDRQATVLQTLHLCLTLFQHLGLSSDLGQKLQNSTRFYNGITHAFILAIGRLSYADAPDWLSSENVIHAEQMRDQARDLFEHVIEEPEEGDMIWAAYQDDGEDLASATEAEQEQDEPEQPDIPMDED